MYNLPKRHEEIGLEVARIGSMTGPRSIVSKKRNLNFAAMYDLRQEFYNWKCESVLAQHFNDPLLVRGCRFRCNDERYHLVQWYFQKTAGRIDWIRIEKSGISVSDLLDLIYLNPELNVDVLKILKEGQKYYSFDKEENGTEVMYFYQHRHGVRDWFCREFNGKITHLGNQSKILLCLLVEFGLWMKNPNYDQFIPETDQQKAIYEVELMREYYRRILT